MIQIVSEASYCNWCVGCQSKKGKMSQRELRLTFFTSLIGRAVSARSEDLTYRYTTLMEIRQTADSPTLLRSAAIITVKLPAAVVWGKTGPLHW